MILLLISSIVAPVGMHIAMSRVPDARLVVEDVVTQTAVGIDAPTSDEVLRPALLEALSRRPRWHR